MWAAVLVVPVAATAAGAQVPAPADRLIAELGCVGCHEGLPEDTDIRSIAPDLREAGLRYNPDYLFGFLQNPVRVRRNIGAARMPNFRLDARESLALTLFLAEQRPPGTPAPAFQLQQTYRDARAANADVTAADGERLFYGLNCAACHQHQPAFDWPEKSGPDLGREGTRVTRDWLRAFLRTPTVLRPFGVVPGTGTRHPDYALSVGEADTIADYLMTLRGDPGAPQTAFTPESLTTARRRTAAALLRDRLPCLGCHRLDGDGGRIGPDLSSAGTRLQPAFIHEMIVDPERAVPGTVMPQIPMPDGWAVLIASYLMERTGPADTGGYFSLVDNPTIPRGELPEDRRSYVTYCAACHGMSGKADGFNVPFLPVVPTRHADADYMGKRADDTLFDAIYAGGYIMNKSPRMPPWGSVLDHDQTRRVVRYMRELCRCEGPSWSRQ